MPDLFYPAAARDGSEVMLALFQGPLVVRNGSEVHAATERDYSCARRRSPFTFIST